ncbi:hypothetical protein BGZ65_005088 [Modicella reniformis]|uniref:Cyclin N-terminal domain-containing protein n=1 Tax=Modicella reniformis TaxID=1440133 RepID=A0A9P6SLC7_9FUNG|nr:hypothetical protein BGZ65_005088 [Modicella reniformis]
MEDGGRLYRFPVVSRTIGFQPIQEIQDDVNEPPELLGEYSEVIFDYMKKKEASGILWAISRGIDANIAVLSFTCVWVAAKKEERLTHISVYVLAFLLHELRVEVDVDIFAEYERRLLKTIGYKMGWPGPLSFLRRCSRADSVDERARLVAKYILEAITLDQRFLVYEPSKQAAAAMYLGRRIYGRHKWTDSMTQMSGYSISDLGPAITDMINFMNSKTARMSHAFDKYGSKEFLRTAIMTREWVAQASSQHITHG